VLVADPGVGQAVVVVVGRPCKEGMPEKVRRGYEALMEGGERKSKL